MLLIKDVFFENEILFYYKDRVENKRLLK